MKSFDPKQLTKSLSETLKKIGGAAGLGIKAILGTLITSGVLFGLGSLLINFEKIIDNMKKTEEGIENFKEKTGEVATAIGVGAGVGIVAKLAGFTLAGGPVGLLALAVVGLGSGITALANSLTNVAVDSITEEEKLRKEYAKSKRK